MRIFLLLLLMGCGGGESGGDCRTRGCPKDQACVARRADEVFVTRGPDATKVWVCEGIFKP